ncbi:MAG: hypothetical protein ABH881_02175 [bacterium]
MKIKLSSKNICNYVFILVVVIDCLAFLYLYSFLKNNVYEAFAPDEQWIKEQSKSAIQDVNEKKIDQVLSALDEKEKGNKSALKNIFRE